MQSTEKKEGFGGIFLRRDLTVLMQNGDQCLEIKLTPAQAIEWAQNLVQAAKEYLYDNESKEKREPEQWMEAQRHLN